MFYPLTDFIATCVLQMPLKPDGTAYSTNFGATLTLSGTYDNRITFNIWTAAMGRANVFDPYIYTGDFILTCTADKAGWGFMNTNLWPVQGQVLEWGLKASQLNFQKNETKTFIARITSNVKGFNVAIYPMTNMVVKSTLTIPSDIQNIHTKAISLLGANDGWRSYSRSGGYDSASGVGLYGLSFGGPTVATLYDQYVPPGDYIVTMTAIENYGSYIPNPDPYLPNTWTDTGWGYLYTSLYP